MKKRQLTTKKKPPTERIIKDIRSLRDSGKSDIEIRALLGIELRTYQRYTKTIYEEDKQVFYDIASQELETELLRLRSCLNHSYNIARKMSEDEKASISDRLEACQAANDCRLSLVQILREYDEFKRKIPISQPESESELEGSVESSNKASTLKRIH